jgi:tRNA G18 (ribose-2'-O)-methylase SpoU
MKLNAKQLRVTPPTTEQLAKIKRKPIYIVLDNVLDTYNIGSIFRLADAIGAMEVVLCGGSETPPNSRLHRAAIGTEEWVPWRYAPNAQDALKTLKTQIPKIKIIAIEQDFRAIPLGRLSDFCDLSDLCIVVVVGHETNGVSKEVLNMADAIVEIPMYGVNKSLNVHVSASIVLYKLLNFV